MSWTLKDLSHQHAPVMLSNVLVKGDEFGWVLGD